MRSGILLVLAALLLSVTSALMVEKRGGPWFMRPAWKPVESQKRFLAPLSSQQANYMAVSSDYL
ncbi:unnamed protein product [Nippostrongylus brasiliensis]|uniref:Apovitellenin I n=1 Tax=Nippostrongylus brasiliensis TaxID=27835 RepID=A0A158QYA9_NIPBR|nr:unnamed protein product [Nippostrongylus brasiliensis]